MRIEAKNVDEYMNQLPPERKEILQKLRAIIQKNLPAGFEETLSYGYPSYGLSREIYPEGYHCKPSELVPYMSFASQKRHIGIYHMALSYYPGFSPWLEQRWKEENLGKMDAGKCCLRFSKPEKIPLPLIGEMAKRITAEEWAHFYRESQSRSAQ